MEQFLLLYIIYHLSLPLSHAQTGSTETAKLTTLPPDNMNSDLINLLF